MTRWALAALLAGTLHAQEVCQPTPLYSVCDLVFEVAPDEAASLQLQAEVKSPRFRTALVPAFPDGGRKWIIRFAPIDAGIYEFRLTSNLARYSGKTGSVTALPSEHPGFIRPANVHHWIHPETLRPHLWLGGFTHQRIALPAADDPTAFASVEKRVREANADGKMADLILAPSPSDILVRYPTWQDRQRWIRLVTSRFSAFDVTWLIVAKFEGEPGARALLKEIGELLKKGDPYNHPRSAGASMTSSPLLADGWMDYINIGTDDGALPAVEHQFYTRPFVTIAAAMPNSADFRKQLWHATMDGQYPSFEGGDPAPIKIWREFFEKTRFWELEPYFDVDGGRALALDETEYIVYVEKPSGPVEVTVAKHGYDVYWLDPATGEYTKEKKDYKGEHFVGDPPSKDRDWVLHLSRDGKKEGMKKSYKFESRQNLQQEPEMTPAKVPFEIAEPSTEQIPIGTSAKFGIKLKRDTRATRSMMLVWTAEVVSSGEGARVIGLGPSGSVNVPKDIARNFPATANVRVAALNANGKAYALDRVYRIVP